MIILSQHSPPPPHVAVAFGGKVRRGGGEGGLLFLCPPDRLPVSGLPEPGQGAAVGLAFAGDRLAGAGETPLLGAARRLFFCPR